MSCHEVVTLRLLKTAFFFVWRIAVHTVQSLHKKVKDCIQTKLEPADTCHKDGLSVVREALFIWLFYVAFKNSIFGESFYSKQRLGDNDQVQTCDLKAS